MTGSESSDPRAVRSRQVITDTAVELLVEHGLTGTTIEAISARSGVAKTTIYRHWPDKRALLLAAVEATIPAAALPDSGSLHGDLEVFTDDLARIVTTPPTSALIPALIDAAERDTEVASLLAHFTAERRKPLRAAIGRAIERGELQSDRDLDVIDDLLLGPLFYRRLLSRRPITPEFTKIVTNMLVAALRA